MRGERTWLSAKTAIAVVSILAGAPGPATAQPVPAPPKSTPSAIPETAWKGVAARAAARIAQLDLRIAGIPVERDYRIAIQALETACQLSPNDADLLRLQIDAANGAHDDQRVTALTKRLLALDTADTVSQLRLISAKIGELQDADSRLAAYDNFLGPQGASFDDSVRSRLALDAAMLLRERGDITGFARRLADATEFDSTNKDAAAIAVAFFTESRDDPIGRLTLLINLLMADPVDPATHLTIARELGAAGVDRGAKRFYENAQAIFAAANQPVPRDVVTEWYTSIWNIDGPEKIVIDLRGQVEEQRAQTIRQRTALEAKAKADGVPPPADLPDPEQIRLTVELERVRAVAASTVKDDGQLQYAMSEITRSFMIKDSDLDNPAKRGGMTEDEVKQRRRWYTGELMWIRLWCGRQVDEAAATLKSIEADPDLPPEGRPTLNRMKGWLLIRQGDLDGAYQMLTPLASDDQFAAIGLALISELRGETKNAGEQFAELSRRLAGTLGGAWCRTKSIRLLGKPPDPPEIAPKLQKLASSVPDWIDAAVSDPRRFLSIQLVLDSLRADVLDRISLTIRLRNVSPIPLGLGPNGPINTRMLLSPKVDVGMVPAATGEAATVVRVDRRLRLLPQEGIDVSCWADSGVLGWFLERMSLVTSHIRWRALQGFIVDENGTYQPGPMCQGADSEALSRSAATHGRESVPGLIGWIQTGSLNDLADCMITIKSRAMRSGEEPGGLSDAEKASLATALAAKYPTVEPSARLLFIAELSPAVHEPWLEPVDKLIHEETDKSVLPLALITRVKGPGDPLLDRAAASGVPDLVALAADLRARLAAGGSGFATAKKPAADKAK